MTIEKRELLEEDYRTLQKVAGKTDKVKGNISKKDMVEKLAELPDLEGLLAKVKEEDKQDKDEQEEDKQEKEEKRELTLEDMTNHTEREEGRQITTLAGLLQKRKWSRAKKLIGNKIYIPGYYDEPQEKAPTKITGYRTFNQFLKSLDNPEGELITLSTGDGNNNAGHLILIIPHNKLEIRMIDDTIETLTRGKIEESGGKLNAEFIPMPSNHGRTYKWGWILAAAYNLKYNKPPMGKYKHSDFYNFNLEKWQDGWRIYGQAQNSDYKADAKKLDTHPAEILEEKGITGMIETFREKISH